MVFAAVPPYSEAYIPATLGQDLPMMLTDWYDKKDLSFGYRSLLQTARDINLTVATKQAIALL